MWTDFLIEYGIFLAKFGTAVFFIMILVITIFILITRSKQGMNEHLDIRNINRKYEHMEFMLRSAIMRKKEFKKSLKELKARHKAVSRGEAQHRRRIFVLDFKGDLKASEVVSLREEISTLLTVAEKDDEVLLRLESGGGTVHGYGLAASQLLRVRQNEIKLTVAVDKVAASGGYMMACVANRIIAAPFAIIGSIGVLAQLPNFNRLLKKHDIDFEEISAGKFKRTLTLFGENTDQDRNKLREELEQAHELFKQFIKDNRKAVDIEKISTGEHWYGKQAIELNLVDELQTSDDYLCRAIKDADLYELEYIRKKPILERMLSSTARILSGDDYL